MGTPIPYSLGALTALALALALALRPQAGLSTFYFLLSTICPVLV